MGCAEERKICRPGTHFLSYCRRGNLRNSSSKLGVAGPEIQWEREAKSRRRGYRDIRDSHEAGLFLCLPKVGLSRDSVDVAYYAEQAREQVRGGNVEAWTQSPGGCQRRTRLPSACKSLKVLSIQVHTALDLQSNHQQGDHCRRSPSPPRGAIIGVKLPKERRRQTLPAHQQRSLSH